MIRHPAPPNTPEWKMARLGVVTASCFDKILTPKTLKPSASADAYLNQLLAEWLLGRPLDDADSAFMERGRELEEEAATWYDMERGIYSEKVGLLLRDDGKVGCSPDRLVGDDGGAEFKCPSAVVHVGYLRDPASLVADYRGQVQGCLYVTKRKWWDVASFNPEIDPVVTRVTPDAAYMDALAKVLDPFVARLDEAKARYGEGRTARERTRDADPIGNY